MGDSSIDSGWFAHSTTNYAPYQVPLGNALAAGASGAFTGPGLNNAQLLAGFFGLQANPANTPGGTNYAIGGAFANVGAGFYTGPFYNPLDGNLFPNGQLPGAVTQINNYLAANGGHANPNALYLISVGGNDGTAALTIAAPLSTQIAYMTGEATSLVNGVKMLTASGARYIIVSDEGAPQFAPTTAVVALFTAYYRTLWGGLAAAGVNFIPADAISVIQAVERNPVAFGITAPISQNACVAPPSLAGSTGYGATCVATTTPSSSYGYLVSANALQTHLFLDGLHMTQAGQLILADYYYSLVVAPSEMSFLPETTVQTTLATVVGIQQQLNSLERQQGVGWNVWANGGLTYLKLDNSSSGFPNDPGYPVAGTFGVDYRWSNGWLTGVAVTGGYLNSTFSSGGTFTQTDTTLSAYAAYRNAGWWGDIIASTGWQDYTTNRLVPIGITMQSNTGSTSGQDNSLAAEFGYEFRTGNLLHGPVIGLILQRVNVGGFTESGSFTSLAFGDQVRDSEVTALGYQAHLDLGRLMPYLQVVWNHECASLNQMVSASLTTVTAPSYSLPAVQLGRDWATLTVGTQAKITPELNGFASVTTQVGQANAVNITSLIGINYALHPG
jgi:outer membrane lipase/esterase